MMLIVSGPPVRSSGKWRFRQPRPQIWSAGLWHGMKLRGCLQLAEPEAGAPAAEPKRARTPLAA
ncbi:MAG: hypothetical protein ABSF10_07105 [Verrucomicrobiota bacterium]